MKMKTTMTVGDKPSYARNEVGRNQNDETVGNDFTLPHCCAIAGRPPSDFLVPYYTQGVSL